MTRHRKNTKRAGEFTDAHSEDGWVDRYLNYYTVAEA